MDQATGPRQIVLCFDGTGYEFRGDDTDSNVLKIYRMLDRNDKNHLHYYQPGIGMDTGFIFVSNEANANPNPIKRWYTKAKDAAFGSTFAEHVMAGYKYLMSCYTPGDRIYFIGFSRGAYVARLLAEMLDHIGLLEAGNEGKVRFLWSIYSKWGESHYSRETSQKEKDDVFQYMKALRETFCRPVTQIDFLGLFDTVNSIPHFEMSRNRFLYPFSTRTTAKTIRHAVSIDEHRAKFRQDLMANSNPISARAARARLYSRQARRIRSASRQDSFNEQGFAKERRPTLDDLSLQSPSPQDRFYRPPPRSHRQSRNEKDCSFPDLILDATSYGEYKDKGQSVEEVWFPGCHADIGGGLRFSKKEDWALSHVPLVWMVTEAQRAGLKFDPEKLKQFWCFDESIDGNVRQDSGNRVASQEKLEMSGKTDERSEFEHALWKSSTNGEIHDCLRYHDGAKWPAVLSWKLLEYFPLRRMHLQKDQSWRPIRWPLPLGEARDIPEDATIHVSALRRLKSNSKYQPRNLKRGEKTAKRNEKGSALADETKEWEVHAHRDCPVRESYRRSKMKTIFDP
ncbi:uncharacterized protein N7511_003922 [Penicillium nucicola]|uniref:uncharacterized protein n=1 Tax=Penicillium nucicola TaxID=1850975 RepID=UPI002544F874|nr:uncharacterized protein N7511_003922 [Penicillium nucicola]KAJ5766306.1 hypothetical protein N7511_003922 [Penicillium nucicola]